MPANIAFPAKSAGPRGWAAPALGRRREKSGRFLENSYSFAHPGDFSRFFYSSRGNPFPAPAVPVNRVKELFSSFFNFFSVLFFYCFSNSFT
ncbi:MAG: hypothetical protein AVDCRST_MAG56-6192 [uncultured Cytophagales bacterium]|uniref:Uncharacterized protein n=1 Tax=uncultured Cytophagales bacterium TaxID=158755 RepID=A0A6J4KN80_9SPHI|nr:MAG: hypothetical protein AVDCRST_MAG56-6192 [uncultured Cytophagales bacterium]